MNSEEERVYDAAVEFIESHGGIVFNPHEKHASIIAKIEVNLEEQAKEKEELNAEFEERKQEAKEDFIKMLGSNKFSYDSVEEMMLGHGLEMDYIEDFIHQI